MDIHLVVLDWNRNMLLRGTNRQPYVLVDRRRRLPRLWAATWRALVPNQAANTTKLHLRHLDSLYEFCDARFGLDALDQAISSNNARRCYELFNAFRLDVGRKPNIGSYEIQRIESTRAFLLAIATWSEAEDTEWRWLSARLAATAAPRPSNFGEIKPSRGMSRSDVTKLLDVAHPQSDKNPFISAPIRNRNWLIVALLLFTGIRRGELLLLRLDSFKRDYDKSGQEIAWMQVTQSHDEDKRATKPSIKTPMSHRPVPVSEGISALCQLYIDTYRPKKVGHNFLLISQAGKPLSAEAVSKVFSILSKVMFGVKSSHSHDCKKRRTIAPHALRHTCATALYRAYLADTRDRELTMQKMRAYFGWSYTSQMPLLYANDAIQEDIEGTATEVIDQQTAILRVSKN